MQSESQKSIESPKIKERKMILGGGKAFLWSERPFKIICPTVIFNEV